MDSDNLDDLLDFMGEAKKRRRALVKQRESATG